MDPFLDVLDMIFHPDMGCEWGIRFLNHDTAMG